MWERPQCRDSVPANPRERPLEPEEYNELRRWRLPHRSLPRPLPPMADLIPGASRITVPRIMSRQQKAASSETLRERCAEILREESVLREGGGKAGLERQRKLGRL